MPVNLKILMEKNNSSRGLMIRGRRLYGTVEDAGRQALKTIQMKSQQRVRARKFAFLMTALVLPLSCLSLYDRLAPLPDQLRPHRFPLLARIYIRKALLFGSKDTEALAKDLDNALWAVLQAGLGAASPQATALLVYLSQRYVEDPLVPTEKLEAALNALTHKPHVGMPIT